MSVLFLQKPSTKVGWQREESQEQEVFLFLSRSLELELFSIPCPALMSFACREGVVENQCLERDSFCPGICLEALICLTSGLSQDRTLNSKYTSLGAVFFPFRNSGKLECVDGLYGLAHLCQLLGFHLTLSLEHLLKAFVSHTDRLCSAIRRYSLCVIR